MLQASETQPKVLYVDDLQTNLILFQATFEQDYDIILAESATEAIEILKEKEIQVLVTDQRMPDMNGTELLEIVAAEYPDIRRFLLTAFTDFETVVEAINKGHIHGYINKPLQADEIRISINNSLEIYHLRIKNRQMLEELEKMNRELTSLDGLKSEIIKVISQEIRTPLNRIMGTMHFLKDKIEGQELSDVVNILDRSVSRLEAFSSMTEQISILKAPGYELKASNVPLKQVIEYSIIEANEELKERDVACQLEDDNNELVIQGESYLLISCMVNLLRNAAQHTGPGEKISIITGQDGSSTICEVCDTGREYSVLLFEELEKQFSPGEKKLNLNLGVELGLAQLIMEAHRGEIVFRKTGDGKGSVQMVFPVEESAS
jgi:signal transduction histidine kinase